MFALPHITAACCLFISLTNPSTNPLPVPQNEYSVALIGDSMTETLGKDTKDLHNSLKAKLPNTRFIIDNFGFGSTNILSVEDRLTKLTNNQGTLYDPILNKKYDFILIESFGNNPLSPLPIKEGLQKQNQALDKIVKETTEKQSQTKLIFVATIAPTAQKYGDGVLNLTPKQKTSWVKERTEYIKNHIKYAKDHNIPLINIYEKSLDKKGEAKLEYINPSDNIHPSVEGLQFISENIANFIKDQRLIKKQ